jgi:subtilisin family serine protease
VKLKSALVALALCVTALVLMKPRTFLEVGAQGSAAVAVAGPGVLVVDLKDDADVDAFAQRHGLTLEYSAKVSKDEALVRANVPDLAAALAQVKADPAVEVAEGEVKMEAFGFPNDPRYAEQWNMRQINALAGWKAGGGRGVTVAVLDTGVSPVADLGDSLLKDGMSFVPGVEEFADGNGHGTHVSGTIAQNTNNGEGVVGVAPNVTIMPFKVLGDQGGGSADRIAAAIDEAADRGVHIINMSLGGGYSEIMNKASADAARRGVLVVASAGNSGREGLGSPASSKEVIAVGATGPDDEKAPYSTYGEGLEIAAPGGNTQKPGGGILQSTVDGQGGQKYAAFQGTSMAAPHVSGALAILLGRGIAPKAAVHTLYASAKDLGGKGYDQTYGHGRIDIGAAINTTVYTRGLQRFGLGIGFAVMLVMLVGLGGREMTVVGVVAGFTAGGAMFVSMFSPGFLTHWLSLDLLRWPALIDASWVHNPVWGSALFGVMVMFVMGLFTRTNLLATGICVGLGTGLICGGVNQSLAAFNSATLNLWWCVGNGIVLLLAGGVLLTARKMELSK